MNLAIVLLLAAIVVVLYALLYAVKAGFNEVLRGLEALGEAMELRETR